jgi:rsbT antagonist protein RsbS
MDNEFSRIPIIKLWKLLLVPLQGELNDDLADQLTAEVLDRIYREGASGIVIDITGLWMVDSHLCSVLTQLSASARLLGAKTIICGLKPEIALTLETMGVELGSTETALDLEAALNSLGLRNPEGEADEHDDDEVTAPDSERRRVHLRERDP